MSRVAKRLASFVAACASLSSASGQGAPQSAHEREKAATARIDSAIGRALALPPELGADYLLRIGPTLGLNSRLRAALVEDILSMVSRAEVPVRMLAVPGISADSEAARRAAASHQGLDRLTLLSRTLDLVGVDHHEITRRVLESMIDIKLSSPTCEDCLFPDPRVLYSSILSALPRAYSKRDIAEGRHLILLRRAIIAVKSPAQIEGAAKLLAEVDVPSSERQVLIGVFGAVLSSMERNDRAFAGAFGSSSRATNAVLRLVSAADQSGALGLLAALRTYFQQFGAINACQDFWPRRPSHRAIEDFNAVAEREAQRVTKPLEPWTRPAELVSCRRTRLEEKSWASISHQVKELVSLRQAESPGPHEPSFATRFDKIRDDIAKTNCESGARCLHVTAASLTSLVPLAPDQQRRWSLLDLAIRRMIHLRQTNESFVFWLSYAREFLRLVPMEDRPFVLSTIRNVGDDPFLVVAESAYKDIAE